MHRAGLVMVEDNLNLESIVSRRTSMEDVLYQEDTAPRLAHRNPMRATLWFWCGLGMQENKPEAGDLRDTVKLRSRPRSLIGSVHSVTARVWHGGPFNPRYWGYHGGARIQ